MELEVIFQQLSTCRSMSRLILKITFKWSKLFVENLWKLFARLLERNHWTWNGPRIVPKLIRSTKGSKFPFLSSSYPFLSVVTDWISSFNTLRAGRRIGGGKKVTGCQGTFHILWPNRLPLFHPSLSSLHPIWTFNPIPPPSYSYTRRDPDLPFQRGRQIQVSFLSSHHPQRVDLIRERSLASRGMPLVNRNLAIESSLKKSPILLLASRFPKSGQRASIWNGVHLSLAIFR